MDFGRQVENDEKFTMKTSTTIKKRNKSNPKNKRKKIARIYSVYLKPPICGLS